MKERNVETVRAVLDAFCRGDVDEAASYFSEDATLRNNVAPDVKRGRAAIREHIARWHTIFSDAAHRELEFVDAGDAVAAVFFGEGTHTGPMGDLPATGRRYSIKYCDVYRFDADGKISYNEGFYDQLSMLRQLGLAT